MERPSGAVICQGSSNVPFWLPYNKDEIAAKTAQVGAFGLTQTQDAAMIIELTSGIYTITAEPADGQPGIALCEIYEL